MAMRPSVLSVVSVLSALALGLTQAATKPSMPRDGSGLTSGEKSAFLSAVGAPAAADFTAFQGNPFFSGNSWNLKNWQVGLTGQQTFSNSDITLPAGTSVALQTGNLSATHTVTLPAANSVAAGWPVTIIDRSGTANNVHYLVAAASGSDTINGASSMVAVYTNYGARTFRSDGTSKWTTDASLDNFASNPTSSSAWNWTMWASLLNAGVAQGDNDYTISATTRAVNTIGALTATRTATLPLASTVSSGARITIADLAGGFSASHYLHIVPSGSDTINGAASFDIKSPYSVVTLVCHNTGVWAVDNSLNAAMADPTSNGSFSATTWSTRMAATQTQAWQGTATGALMTPDNVEQAREAATPQQFRNTLRALTLIYTPPASVSVSSITWSGSLATVTLASAPSLPLVAGDTFALSGATPSDYNTGWQIASVTDTTHFTFSTVGSAIAAGATGTITFQQTAQLNLCAVGDSVAGKKPKYLFPEITRGMPINSISSQTYTTGGDCVINNSDFTIEAAGGSFSLGSGTGWATFGTGGTNPKCDTVTVIYAKESGAGIFKLQASTDAGSPVTWTDISGYTSIDASNASLAAGVITLKFPYGYHGVRAMSVSGGRVRICNIISRAESTSGWNRGDLNQGGIAQSQMASEQSDFQSAEIAAINPTLWSSEWKDSAATVPTYLPVLVSAFQAVKKADWIFNATTPVSSDAAYDSNPTTAPTYLENLETQKIARAGGYFYFGQGWWMWQTYAELLRLGLQGDGTHVNLIADNEMAAVEARDLWFLIAPPGHRSADTQFVSTQLGLGNTPSVPAIKWTINTGTGDVTIARGTGNYTYFDDPSGNHIMILSSSSALYANPSQLPGYILYGSGSESTFMQVDGPSHAVLWRTATGNGTTNYYSDVDAPLRALNVPAYFQQGGTYTLICGVGAIAANSTGNYTLPSSPKQNGIYAISSLNVGWTLHQLAGQIIRSGSHVTTLGTSGSIDGTSADSITLLYTGTAGGNQEWRIIAGGDSSDLVYH